VGFTFLPNFWFLSNTFGSRDARMTIMGCKDLDDSLVSKTIELKNGLLGCRPGPGKLDQNGENMPAL